MDIELTTDQWLAIGIAAGVWLLLGVVSYALATTRKRTTTGWLRWLAREPVRVRTAVVAIIAVAGSFGLPVTAEQQALIVGAVLAVLAIFSETTRAKVTPVADPRLE